MSSVEGFIVLQAVAVDWFDHSLIWPGSRRCHFQRPTICYSPPNGYQGHMAVINYHYSSLSFLTSIRLPLWACCFLLSPTAVSNSGVFLLLLPSLSRFLCVYGVYNFCLRFAIMNQQKQKPVLKWNSKWVLLTFYWHFLFIIDNLFHVMVSDKAFSRLLPLP